MKKRTRKLACDSDTALSLVSERTYTLMDSISEYCKNSIEANAKNVWIDFQEYSNQIIIKDDGDGIHSDEFNVLDKIGISNKRFRKKKSNQILMGEYGIGIYSCFCKCNKLTIHTKHKIEKKGYTLEFDYQRYGTTDESTLTIDDIVNVESHLPHKKHGTIVYLTEFNCSVDKNIKKSAFLQKLQLASFYSKANVYHNNTLVPKILDQVEVCPNKKITIMDEGEKTCECEFYLDHNDENTLKNIHGIYIAIDDEVVNLNILDAILKKEKQLRFFNKTLERLICIIRTYEGAKKYRKMDHKEFKDEQFVNNIVDAIIPVLKDSIKNLEKVLLDTGLDVKNKNNLKQKTDDEKNFKRYLEYSEAIKHGEIQLESPNKFFVQHNFPFKNNPTKENELHLLIGAFISKEWLPFEIGSFGKSKMVYDLFSAYYPFEDESNREKFFIECELEAHSFFSHNHKSILPLAIVCWNCSHSKVKSGMIRYIENNDEISDIEIKSIENENEYCHQHELIVTFDKAYLDKQKVFKEMFPDYVNIIKIYDLSQIISLIKKKKFPLYKY